MNLAAPLNFLKSFRRGPQIKVRAVTHSKDLQTVYTLTHDCYVSKGYCAPQPNGLLTFNSRFDSMPETTVFVAEVHNQIVGSVSLTMDGPNGFPFEKDFPDEVSQLRKTQRGLGAIWRLVVDKSTRANIKIVKALLKEVVLTFQNSGGLLETALLTVNPSHEKIYNLLLNMTSVARAKTIHGLANAPAVLLRCNLNDVPLHWRRA